MRKRGVSSSCSGQVTIFIILGIILFFTIAVIFYLQYAFREEAPVSFEVSEEPVTRFVQSCLLDVAKEALQRAALQGGYLYLDELSEEDKEVLELLPFNSDVLLLAGKQQLPYWYYQKNDGIDRVAIPELEMQAIGDNSIQDQFERYITEHLPVCFDDFASLEETGIDIAYAGELFISTTIRDESIEVDASLPLTITQDGTETTQEEFVVIVPTPFKQLYDLARVIAEYELETLFLEQTTRNLLSMYGQADKTYLPPMAEGLHFESCSDRQYWFYSDVQQKVEQMLAANIPYLQIANTQFSQIKIGKSIEPDTEKQALRQAIFDAFVQYPTATSHEDLAVRFQYQTTYPLELLFGNNVGYGLIQPDVFEINALITNFCLFDYSFLYTLKFPVVITLQDTTSEEESPLLFQFPLQVVIRNNNPRVRLNDVFATQFTIPETAAALQTWQCDPQQRLSAESTVTVLDAKGAPVENAFISFQCGPGYVYRFDENGTATAVEPFAKACYMGTTDEQGKLTTQFPPCIGAGFVTVNHDSYLEKSEATGDIRQATAVDKTIVLDKIYTRKILLQKYFVAPPSETNKEGIGVHIDEKGEIIACNRNLKPQELQAYESAIISLTKLDTENGVFATIPLVVYNPASEEPATLDIAPGRYLVDIMLLRDERYPGEMTIKANSQGITVATATGTDTITYPEEDLLMPQAFTGGAVFTWDVTAQDLESSDTIVFNIFDEGEPKLLEQVNAPLAHREACSALEATAIQPLFD